MEKETISFTPEDSSCFNLQQCSRLPTQLMEMIQPYSYSLDEHIVIRVVPSRDSEHSFHRVRSIISGILTRISVFMTTIDSAKCICSDLRVKEVDISQEVMLYVSKWPRLDAVDVIIAYSIDTFFGNYWDQFAKHVIEISDEVPAIRLLKSGVIRSMTVTVVYEELSELGEHNDTTAKQLSQQLLRSAFKSYGIHVKANTVLDLRECPMLFSFPTRIAFIFVHDCCMANSVTEIGRMSNKTLITIRTNHELNYFHRIQDAIARVPQCLPGLDSAYRQFAAALQLPNVNKPCNKHFYSGILLSGPSGSGKKQLIAEVARKYIAKIYRLNMGTESPSIRNNPQAIVTKLKTIFENSQHSSADCGYPVVIVLENLDILRTNDTGTAFRLQRNKLLLTNCIADLLDNVGSSAKVRVPFVVVAVTTKPYLIPEKLKVGRRLDQEIFMTVPDMKERTLVLKRLVDENPELECLDVQSLGRKTPGYVASDLIRLINLALLKSHERSDVSTLEEHVKFALSRVLPSVLQGCIGVVSSHLTADLDRITGLETVKMDLIQAIVWPLTQPQALEHMGIRPPTGIILYGPSGCGKTSLVRAIASAHHTNFISVSSAELFCSGVGDSEKIIAHLFHLARQASPCVLFIDELDSIVGSREGKSGKGVNNMILSMLLTEMDGIGQRQSFAKRNLINQGFVVVGATNRPEAIDSALLRPGRFDRLLPVQPPNLSDRVKLLESCTTKTKLGKDVAFEEIGERTERFSGADIINLCREAGMHALSEDIEAPCVSMKHYRQALTHCSPSISQNYLDHFYDYVSKNSNRTLTSPLSPLKIN